MPGHYSSHPTTVTFAGSNIGYLTDYDVDAQAGQLYDSTNITSLVIGTGLSARVLRQVDCTSIEPPTISLRFWGPLGRTAYEVGMKGLIEFTSPGDYLTGEAILVSWKHAGRKGQWSTGEATFKLTGHLE